MTVPEKAEIGLPDGSYTGVLHLLLRPDIPGEDVAFVADLTLKVFDDFPDAVSIVSGESGLIFLVNRRMELLSGYYRAELRGKSIDMLVPEAVQSRHAGLRAKYAADPRVRTVAAGLGTSLLTKTGQEVPVDITLAPVPTERGMFVIATLRRREDS